MKRQHHYVKGLGKNGFSKTDVQKVRQRVRPLTFEDDYWPSFDEWENAKIMRDLLRDTEWPLSTLRPTPTMWLKGKVESAFRPRSLNYTPNFDEYMQECDENGWEP